MSRLMQLGGVLMILLGVTLVLTRIPERSLIQLAQGQERRERESPDTPVTSPRPPSDHQLRRSPFRLDGVLTGNGNPAPTAGVSEPVVAEPATVYPVVLRAIVGGPPWLASLAGLPGEAGERVVRVGDTIGIVRIDEVSQSGVRLSTPDTTWFIEWPEPIS
jgi:hypothetical protein